MEENLREEAIREYLRENLRVSASLDAGRESESSLYLYVNVSVKLEDEVIF